MPYGDEQWHPHNVHNITTTNADSDDKLVRRMSGQIEENLADLTVNTS